MKLECLFFGHEPSHYIDLGRPTDDQLKTIKAFVVPYRSKPIAVCGRCGAQVEFERSRHGRLPELILARD